MSKYDLSIIIPSIRVQNLEAILFSAEKSVEPFSFEMIIVGPYELPDSIRTRENVKFFKDFGSPSRCVQIGSTLAEGKYMCWMSDDGLFVQQTLAQCLNKFETSMTDKDAITLRYFEGEGQGEFPENYWTAWTHEDQRLSGIAQHFKCAPLGMYNTEYFRDLGGLDCRYEHINMCTHDLAFRLQQNGGTVHLSPSTVARFYWSWNHEDAKPIQRAYHEVDAPLYKEMWSQDQSNRIKIDYWNWMNAESRWKKRFGD